MHLKYFCAHQNNFCSQYWQIDIYILRMMYLELGLLKNKLI